MKQIQPDKKSDLVTCVSLSKNNRNKLAKLGTKDQTFEDIILELMPKPKGDENE